jgi:hypothetical protein
MTDETPKKHGGWPKGKPRKAVVAETATPEIPMPRPGAVVAKASLLGKMKARPNWDDDTILSVGEDGVDRLKIPDDIIERLARDGIALQWITRSVRGQHTPQEISKYTKGGWTPVHQSDFDGLLDGLFMPKGVDDVIGVEDAMLVARPLAIHQKAREHERRAARAPLAIKEAELGQGINVPGGNHPSATRQNRINKTVERIDVPE